MSRSVQKDYAHSPGYKKMVIWKAMVEAGSEKWLDCEYGSRTDTIDGLDLEHQRRKSKMRFPGFYPRQVKWR